LADFFANSTNSLRLLNGALARATIIGPPVATIDSGVKSFTGS
jgi:hypothetical protein